VRAIRILAFVICAAVVGCASPSTRLAWNLKHADVHKNVRIPRAEIDQIIRIVSRESIFPILLITQEKTKHGDQISVYTDLEHDPQRYMVYDLQKQSDGLWHIVFSGNGSIIIIDET
jgi:hypothetical protein